MDKPMPISEAVAEGTSERGVIIVDMRVLAPRGNMHKTIMKAQLYAPDVRGDCSGQFITSNASDAQAHVADVADAATALRAIADQLAPDPQAKALEIAAQELVERSMGCPFEFYDWQRCPAGGETSSNVCGIQTMTCWRIWLLQQAREFFAEQAKEDPPCST